MKQLDWNLMLQQKEPAQRKGIPPPAPHKQYPEEEDLIDLVRPEEITLGRIPLLDVINKRRSRRNYNEESLILEELALLLWSTQGIQQELDRGRTIRTTPAGGALHPFETYLFINRVKKLKPGLYRYIAKKHKLLLLRKEETELHEELKEAIPGEFVRNAAVVFIWTAIPYRKEWRYGTIAYKDILIDIGHVCQNLYLTSESFDAGTCAILSYDQKKTDRMLGVDGEDEFAIYIATVGKISE